jgi:hypothetical protein
MFTRFTTPKRLWFNDFEVVELEDCWDCSGEGFEDLVFFDEEVEVDKVFECCESCELKDCDKVDCSVPY